MKTALPRVRALVAVVGASVLTLAGPTAAAMALEDDLSGSLGEADQQQTQGTETSTAEEAGAEARAQDEGPLEELCNTAFADQEDARTQCLEFAGMIEPNDGGEDDSGDGDEESDDPFQQFCATAFADQEDARTQCEEFADTLAGDEGGEDDDGAEDDGTGDEGSEDDGTQDDGSADEGDGDEAGDNPFMEFCATAFADQEDARTQCEEFAGMFPGTGGGDEGANPFQQFCDEAFADNEDAHAQCSEFAQALGGGQDGGEDDGSDDEPDPAGEPDEGNDGGDDASGVMGDSVASPAPDGSLAFTGVDAGVAGAVALALLALGGALLRRVRLQA